VLSHRNVKHRVFTHGLGVFVLSHIEERIVYLHMQIRVFTHDVSCFHTSASKNRRAATMGYRKIESLNTDSNFI